MEFVIKLLYIWIPILGIVYYFYLSKRWRSIICFKLYVLELCNKRNLELIDKIKNEAEVIDDDINLELDKLKEILMFPNNNCYHKFYARLPGNIRMLLFSFKKIKLENYFREEEVIYLRGERKC